jgi:hypothetical protein
MQIFKAVGGKYHPARRIGTWRAYYAAPAATRQVSNSGSIAGDARPGGHTGGRVLLHRRPPAFGIAMLVLPAQLNRQDSAQYRMETERKALEDPK